jgi:transporter family-2 protein
MVRITESVSTVIITLVINSSVGLVLLVSLLLMRSGVGGVSEAVGALRPWFVIPGLLGSFFVFAGIMGYQNVGAATTIAVVVGTQLIVGLIVDAYKAGGSSFSSFSPPSALSCLGAVLLIAGAILIARERV